jgi:hypothetical protein
MKKTICCRNSLLKIFETKVSIQFNVIRYQTLDMSLISMAIFIASLMAWLSMKERALRSSNGSRGSNFITLRKHCLLTFELPRVEDRNNSKESCKTQQQQQQQPFVCCYIEIDTAKASIKRSFLILVNLKHCHVKLNHFVSSKADVFFSFTVHFSIFSIQRRQEVFEIPPGRYSPASSKNKNSFFITLMVWSFFEKW